MLYTAESQLMSDTQNGWTPSTTCFNADFHGYYTKKHSEE